MCLNALERCVCLLEAITPQEGNATQQGDDGLITTALVTAAIAAPAHRPLSGYTSNHHYDCISALHKSIRGSDVNGALYYLGGMLAGGDDPIYIARRLIRIASEDIGLGDSACLPLAVATHAAVLAVGKS